jgi:hypothetical protein
VSNKRLLTELAISIVLSMFLVAPTLEAYTKIVYGGSMHLPFLKGPFILLEYSYERISAFPYEDAALTPLIEVGLPWAIWASILFIVIRVYERIRAHSYSTSTMKKVK